ncbi:hypothetical protein SAMN05216303_11129 [Rhodoferax sp. OV413]|uniref:hypothetical protein n=1 Tax=Rhodoferax sp. OV413 TaxID=1855285 RepID=UPI00088B3115|nr:hypothetical protein [Rhodoferax sp. OV413]SDP92867.1 hypothetical protein SAMN05216303_11129 [Rhodoferax sp. OV413]
MQNAYLGYVEKDEGLWRVVEPILPRLTTLSAEQVETLVFYLKSLHGYCPSSANELQNQVPFETRLDAIRNNSTQDDLQSKARWRLRLGILICIVAGFLSLPGVLGLFAGEWETVAVWGLPALALVFLADYVGFLPAINTFKQQDRRYFLESIRAAQACNELDWSGLFTYNGETKTGPQNDEAIHQTHLRIAGLTQQLRTALYNDEYMNYSRPRG